MGFGQLQGGAAAHAADHRQDAAVIDTASHARASAAAAPGGGRSVPVRIDSISKRFGDFPALSQTRLELAAGEFFTLLGPSGCGKTTLLRILAGFLRQDTGHIWFGDRLIDDVPPNRRNTGMVFQNYAIFPHLTVRENIAYGLKARGLPAAEIERRVARVLAMTHLQGLIARKPQELSGGQQQRVVLARTIVIEPEVLLMDEPLSNLDAELRVHLRREIRALQREIGVTTIYVTHDQEEALSLSDRIAVMQRGRIEQVGTPSKIYSEPATRFVAGFVGESNFLPAQRRGEALADGTVSFRTPGGVFAVPAGRVHGDDAAVVIGFRPHQAHLCAPGADASLSGEVIDAIYTGDSVRHVIRVAEGCDVVCLMLTSGDMPMPRVGERVGVRVAPSSLTAFPGTTG
ncbi:MAG: ABC transporter ATP-binding protein [Burkholderiales bacterium]|nr:ABC transporter ATP-binding protein [Burkholderiales bacterium]